MDGDPTEATVLVDIDTLGAAHEALLAWGNARRENNAGRLHGWEYVRAMRNLDAAADAVAARAHSDANRCPSIHGTLRCGWPEGHPNEHTAFAQNGERVDWIDALKGGDK